MDSGFCLPYQYLMVDVYGSGIDSYVDCLADCKFPGHQSRRRKPCEKFENGINIIAMIKNYFKTAWRNLLRQKTLAFINVFGLSVGIAFFILLLLYSVIELSFDRFNKNAKNIYCV